MAQTDLGFRPLGRYRIVERLGAGGMAEVFRAVVDGPAGFARSVVIKRVLPEDAALGPAARAALVAEARLCSLLHHPNIVQVHELGEDAGEYFLVMELVDGVDLGRILRKCIAQGIPMPPGVACHLVSEVAQALAYAHALPDGEGRPLGLIHRDVSPSNVMVSRTGGVKLLDFGIAKIATADELTRTGTLKGKIPYMSPEQADGRRLDHRSDIFSLGVLFHECLTSQRLFPRDAELETLRLVRQAQVAPPSTVRPDLDPEIDRVVMRMLARAVEDRTPTCDQLVAELRPLVRRLDGDATSLRRFVEELLPSWRGVAVLAEEGAAEPPPPSEARTSSRGAPPPGSRSATRPPTRAFAPARGWRSARGALVVAALVAGAAALWRLERRAVVAAPPAARTAAPPVAQSARASVPTPPTPTTSPATPIVTTPATPPAPPAAATVRLRVVGQAHARVRIDGRDVGALPLDLQLPARPEARAVTVAAPGFAPFRERVAGDSNGTLAVRLVPLAKREAHAHHPSHAPAPFDPESALPP